MQDILRRIIRHPWATVGAFFGLLVCVGLMLFAIEVVRYAGDIQAGKPNPFTAREREVSVTKLLSQIPLTNTDASRVESKGTDPMLGNPSAKIRIVEFLDFECPFCRTSAPEIRTFMARHANDVLLIVRDFPLESIHDQAMNAAIAARCVFAQGNAERYWRYHDLLYAAQESLGPAMFRTTAETVGADLTAYDACVASRVPETGIRASIEDGTAAGVRGTPTFFVNGYRVQGAVDLATLEEIFSQMKKRL